MKKLIGFIYIAMLLLSMSITALAGSIPEDLLYEDYAQVFFAEVVGFQQADNGQYGIEFIPTKKNKR